MRLTKIVSFLTASVLTVSGLLPGMQIPAFAATDDTAVQTGAQVQTSANSQVGEILSNAINEETSKVQSPDNYFIDSITVSGNTATVNYSALIDCQLVVGVYEKCTPDSKIYESMITLGTASVKKEEQTAIVVFQDTVMPQYFQLRAYLIRDDGALLSEEYVESGYTKEIMDLKASSTFDYNPDQVLNLDSNNETNFAVLKDNVKVLVPDSSANIIQTSENGTYQIQNLSKALEKGDVVAIRTDNEGSNQDAAVFRVDTVSKSGSITTITADSNFDAAEAFAFMKVEIDPDESVSKFEPADGIEIAQPSQPAPGQKVFSNSVTFSKIGEVDNDNTHAELSLGYSFSGTIEWNIGIDYYLADHFTDSLLYFEISGSFGGSVGAEADLFIPIGEVSAEVFDSFRLVAGIYIEVDISASVNFATDFSFSTSGDNSFDFRTCELEGSGFLGIVSRLKTKVGDFEREAVGGIGAKITLSRPFVDHQGCKTCLEGDVSVIVYGRLENNDTELYNEIALLKNDIYLSDPLGFGIGTCPNKLGGGSASDNTGQSDADNNSIEKYLDFIDNGDGTYSVTLKANITERCDPLVIPAYYNGGKVISIIKNDSNDHPYRGGIISIIIPDTVTEVGDDAFDGCANFMEVTFLSSGKLTDKTINQYAFDRCRLRKVTLPYGLTQIPNSFFYYQYGLSEVVIPDSVTTIGDEAFRDCRELTKIEIPDSVTSIGDGAFNSCTSLSKIEIPDSVTHIGDSAFRGCTSLSNFEIPDSVTSIGTCAFSNCTNLTSITLSPDIDINSTSFSICSNLSYIYFEGTTDEWNSIKWYDVLGKQIDYDPYFVNYAKVICRKDNKIISYEKGQPTPTISNYGTVQSGSTAKQPLQTTLTNLIPDTLYNFYCYTGSTFNAKELLYITQGKTDENGNLSVTYYPVEKNGAAQNTVEDAKCFPSTILGDMDLDGKINIADVVLLQKWLLAMPDTVLLVWEAGDINGDKKLNAKDLTELKRALLEA